MSITNNILSRRTPKIPISLSFHKELPKDQYPCCHYSRITIRLLFYYPWCRPSYLEPHDPISLGCPVRSSLCPYASREKCGLFKEIDNIQGEFCIPEVEMNRGSRCFPDQTIYHYFSPSVVFVYCQSEPPTVVLFSTIF